jgi:hypothetical protein
MSRCRLTFRLPLRLAFALRRGRHHPCLAGCMLEVLAGDIVSVTGPSRQRVFAQARRFLAPIAKGHGPLSLAGSIETATERGPPERDAWQIILGAEVSFAPTGIEADVGCAGA